MDSDISWYEEGQKNVVNQPSTSGTQHGRPPDTDMREVKPDAKNFIEAVCLVDDEDDPEEAINSFHNLTRKKILLPFTGMEIQDEFKFLEAIKQFKMILEEKVEVLTLRKNLKEMLYKYLLFFGTNYGRISVLHKDQYLDTMEDILVFYCDVIREYFRDQKRQSKKMKLIQEARRIKILFRDCLLKNMDRILHVLLKVRMAPDIEEYSVLWGDVYMYFLTKVPFKYTDDDILRGFIAFQKFKTIRAKSEAAMIDKLMLGIYKKSFDELRRIPCLGEIMDKMKRDCLYTVRDMITGYMRYYKEKRRRSERFDIDDCEEEDTEDVNATEMQQLDLSDPFASSPSIFGSSLSTSQPFSDRRPEFRKTHVDRASDSNNFNSFIDQRSDELFVIDDDILKVETVPEPVVVLDDEDDDDVVLVSDNLKTVITIDDEDEEEIQPTKSPPPPPPPEIPLSTDNNNSVETTPLSQLEETDMSASKNTPSGSPTTSMEVEKSISPSNSMEMEITIPEKVISSKEPLPAVKSTTPLKESEIRVPEKAVSETYVLKRQVKEVDNSLKITLFSLPPQDLISQSAPNKVSTSELQNSETSEGILGLPPEKSMERPPNPASQAKGTLLAENSAVQNVSSPSDLIDTRIVTASVSPSLEKKMDSQVNPHENTSVPHEHIPTPDLPVSAMSLSSNQNPPENASVPHSSNKEIEKLSPPTQNMVSDQPVSEKSLPPEEQVESRIDSVKSASLTPDLNEKMPKPTISEKEASYNEPMETAESGAVTVTTKETVAAHSESEKDVPPNQPVEMQETPTNQNVSDGSVSTNTSTTTDSSSTETGTDQSNVTEKDSSNDDSASLMGPVNSTMNEGIVGLMGKTSISPIIKGIVPRIASKKAENNKDSTIKRKSLAPFTKRIGVLPSSKIPDDLDSEGHDISETSNISSPSYETIDKNDARKFFGKVNQDINMSTSGTSETETSTSTKISDSISSPVCPELNSNNNSKLETSLGSDASAADESDWNIQDNTVIQVQHTGGSQHHNENAALKTFETPYQCSTNTQTQETLLPASQSDRANLAAQDYSAINEFITKFTKELSGDDISVEPEVPTSAAPDLTLPPVIDLAASAENVIVVNCRRIEPPKVEEEVASGADTVSFSAEEVLAPPHEPIALLVSYPGGSSQEEGHYVMYGTQLASLNDDLASFNNDASTKALRENRTALPPRRATEDSAPSLSGSQPYTPQSSPSTRVETVGAELNNLENGSSTPYPCLKDDEAARKRVLSSHLQKSTTIKVSTLNKSSAASETVPVNTNKVTKRRKSSENSLKASESVKSRRKSSELPESSEVAHKIDTRSCNKISRPAAADFREDLSQSLTSAKGVTPQAVVEISKLPLKYSQHVSELHPFHSQENISQQKSGVLQQKSITSPQSQSKSAMNEEKHIDDRSVSFVEKTFNDLYIREYGNDPYQEIQRKRRNSQETFCEEVFSPIRPLKTYAKAKDRPPKDISQNKERDISIKSYKSLIKNVSRRRSSLSQKDEAVSHPSSNASHQKDTLLQLGESRNKDNYIYDQGEFWSNGMEGPIGKPMGNTDYEENFLWDNDIDSARAEQDGLTTIGSGTISVKPDSQLYQEKKGSGAQEACSKKTSQDILVSSLKSSRMKALDQRSPEKKKVTFSNKHQIKEIPLRENAPVFNKELSVNLPFIDLESYKQEFDKQLVVARKDQQKQLSLAYEMKQKQERQISLANEMKQKQQQSLHRGQILLQISSDKTEPSNNNWFAKTRAHFSANSPVSSNSHFTQGKVREQGPTIHKNGHKVAEKRKNRDLETDDDTPKKKLAVRLDLIEKKAKISTPNGKITATKLKPIIKSPKTPSKDIETERNDMEQAPSSPVKTTKSGRVCKKPRQTDFVVNYRKSNKLKKSVKFSL